MPVKCFCCNCLKLCRCNQNCIQCDICNNWLYLKCTQLTDAEFMSLGASDMPYYCPACNGKLFPFNGISDNDFKSLLIEPRYDNLTRVNVIGGQYCSATQLKDIYSHSNDFTLLHVNTRSIMKNLDKLEELLYDLAIKPDITAISETKLKDNTPFKPSLPNYLFVNSNSKTNAGGVGIFIKSYINFDRIHSFDLTLEGCEDIWIEVKLSGNKKCIIGVVYRHQTNNAKLF